MSSTDNQKNMDDTDGSTLGKVYTVGYIQDIVHCFTKYGIYDVDDEWLKTHPHLWEDEEEEKEIKSTKKDGYTLGKVYTVGYVQGLVHCFTKYGIYDVDDEWLKTHPHLWEEEEEEEEEEESDEESDDVVYNTGSCYRGCSGGWDIRQCCELDCPKKNTNRQFRYCPMKLSTIAFTLGNDRGLYEIVQNNDWSIIKQHYKLSRSELKEVRESYEEDHEYNTDCETYEEDSESEEYSDFEEEE